MNKKKITLSIILIISMILLMVIPNKSKASTTLTNSLYFGIQEFRSGTDPEGLAYAIGNPYDNATANDKLVGAKIWQIVKYNNNNDTTYTTGNYYCVKAGVGFSDTTKKAEYNISYDFVKEKNEISSSGKEVLASIVEDDRYYKILALADLLYLPDVSSDEEKAQLLADAEIEESDYTYKITDSDIEAVQQAALWYFTNDEEVYNKYDEDRENTSWFCYSTEEMSKDKKEYKSFSDYKPHRNSFGQQTGEGLERQKQAVYLYNYLIEKAEENAAKYQSGEMSSKNKITLYSNRTIDVTQPLILIEKVQEINGEYNLYIEKQDANGEIISDADVSFTISRNSENAQNKTFKGSIELEKQEINSTNYSIEDVYEIKEILSPDGYNRFDGTIIVKVKKKKENNTYKIDSMTYTIEDAEGNDITNQNNNSVIVTLDEAQQKVIIKVKNYQNDGSYNLILVKEDASGEQLDSKATFEVNGEEKNVIGRLEIAKNVKITEEDLDTPDTYVIKELVPPDEYCKFYGTITIVVKKKNENGIFKVDDVTYTVTDEDENDITEQSEKDVNVYLNDDGNIYVEVKDYQFDLKLVKRIVEVNGVSVDERIEDVDITNLANGTQTTADYDVNKNYISVKKGDIIKYTLRVYNEGEIDGYASEITEDIPEGLELLWSEKTGDELEADTTLSEEEKKGIAYNQLIWSFKTVNSSTNKVEMVTTDYLAKGKGLEVATDGANLIKAFDASREYKNTINDKNPDYKEISVYMRVTSEDATGTIIRNEAAITNDTDKEGNPVEDRDSKPDDWVKYEDDEDYDNIILKSFDLALRKFIIAVSKDTNIEESEYLKNANGTYTRAPEVDTSELNTIGEDGKIITTAKYNHPKDTIGVEKKDIVVYMIRVYNEGEIDGYASEIKDHLPPYLEYVDGEFNDEYGWKLSEDGRTVTTKYLENKLISGAKTNSDGKIVLSYKEVPIMCKVKDNAQGKITNIADITEYKDENKEDIKDRDSEEDNVKLPSDENLPNYKDDETGEYIPGQQDDDDFEKVEVKIFDLALRKFITGVNEENVTTRIPEVSYDEKNNKLTYNHTKQPVDVVTQDIVTYTIRVYNEGETDGYASKISDDIPEGLEFLPEHLLNKEYRWVMYDKDGNITQDVSKAEKITTDYLSKEQGEARMEEDDTLEENPALLSAFDKTKEISDTNPDYADVKVVFKVVEPNSSNKILVNSAQISEDTDKNGNPVDDEDSTPDKWNDGEDDQDKEYVELKEFDLALRKWVTQAIVIENGKQTVTDTGHKAEDDPEEVVKVEIHRKKINEVIVKFKYSIRITNEGDIEGYAKEITDYVPAGLKFEKGDNPDWVDEGNNVISTKKLENTLLKPGESAEVEVILTWINGSNNLGLKTNIAEISEDYNDKHVPDRDSTPDNKKPEEDDQDDAPVLLTVSTGLANSQSKVYIVLAFAVLITTASGIILIKKFIL